MTEKLKKDMIDGNIVNSIQSPQVDNTDSENPILPEFLLPDGSNSNGGSFFIDQILSERFANYKQVLTVKFDNSIEYGNVELTTHRFLITNENGLKVKVGSAEYTIYHSGNLTNVSQLNNDAGYLQANDLDGFVYDVQYNSSAHTITFYQQNEPNIVIDLPIESLIKGVQLVGNDLVFTFEDGSTVTVPLNTLLVGVVKSVNGLTPNSQGEIILNVTDIPNLSSELANKLDIRMVGLVNDLTQPEKDAIHTKLAITNNVTQVLSLSGNTLTLSAGGGSVNLGIVNIGGLQTALDLKANANGNNLTNIVDWQNTLGVGFWNQYDGSTTVQNPTLGLLYDSSVNKWRPSGNDVYRNWLDVYSTTEVDGFLAGKANTSGYYSGLHVGNADLADNATRWDGLFYAGISPVANIEGILVKETGLNNAWATDKASILSWLNLVNEFAFIDGSNATGNLLDSINKRHDAVTLGTPNGLSLSGQVISLGLASASSNGALSSIDWNNFNSKTSNLGTVTSITAGTGLSGGTITTNGTIALNSATLASLALADTALQIANLNGYATEVWATGEFAKRDGSNLLNINDWRDNLSVYSVAEIGVLLSGKANTSGYYSGLDVGNADLADNATRWGGLFYAGISPVANIEGILVKETGFNNAWTTDQNSIINWLGINTSWNLQQVTDNGASTTHNISIPNAIANDHAINLGQLLSYNYASNTALGNYVSKLNVTENIDGEKTFIGNATQWLRNGINGFIQVVGGDFVFGTLTNNDVKFYRNAISKITIGDSSVSFVDNVIIPNATAPNHAVNKSQLDAVSASIPNAANNGLLTISTSADLTGGGTFGADQATASNVTIGLSSTVLSNIQLGVTANSWGNHALAGYALASSIPAQVNIIQGTGISVTGTYPNITITNSAPNVQADWNATSGLAEILNKPTIQTPNNGTFTVQGTGALTGIGSTSADASANTSAILDLTTATKNDINAGKNASTQVNNLFGSISKYYKLFNMTGGGFVDANEQVITQIFTTSGTQTINISDHTLDGADLKIYGASGGVTTVNINAVDLVGSSLTTFNLEGDGRSFHWSNDTESWVEYFN